MKNDNETDGWEYDNTMDGLVDKDQLKKEIYEMFIVKGGMPVVQFSKELDKFVTKYSDEEVDKIPVIDVSDNNFDKNGEVGKEVVSLFKAYESMHKHLAEAQKYKHLKDQAGESETMLGKVGEKIATFCKALWQFFHFMEAKCQKRKVGSKLKKITDILDEKTFSQQLAKKWASAKEKAREVGHALKDKAKKAAASMHKSGVKTLYDKKVAAPNTGKTSKKGKSHNI